MIKELNNHSLHDEFPISNMAFFAESSAKEVSELNNIRQVFQLKPEQRVPMTKDGQPGFYYIHNGFAKLVFRRNEILHTIRIVGPDDLIGYARWQAPPSYTYMLSTLSHATVSFFRKDDFFELQSKSPYLMSEATRWLMKVLTNQEEQIFTLKNTSAKSRVAGTLENLRKKFGKTIGGKDSLNSVPLDRKTLADLSGVVIEVLSRALGELEKDGIITRQGRVITIADVKALEKTANT